MRNYRELAENELRVPDDVDEQLFNDAVSKIAETIYEWLDLSEAFNVTCAFHNIPLIVNEDGNGELVVVKHDYVHENPKIQTLVEWLRATIHSAQPSHYSKRVYMELLARICDTYNYRGFKSLREVIEHHKETRKQAHDDQWNSGNWSCSHIRKFMSEIADKEDDIPLDIILRNLLRVCSKEPNIVEDQYYKTACMALYGRPNFPA